MTRKTNIFKSKRFARIARRVSAILAAAVAMSCVAASAINIVDAESAAAVKPGDSVNALVASQPTLPLSEYPDGSTYPDSYLGAIQCAGFARYVFDKYSHISRTSGSWPLSTSDTHRHSMASEISAKDLADKIKNLPAGSYVRVTNSTSAPNGSGGHSFIVISATDTYVKVYDANYVKANTVSVRIWYYTDIAERYKYLYETVYHNFVKSYDYDDSYHKTTCATSGCSGYVLEKHTPKLNNGKFACTKCGHQFSIIPEIMSTGYNIL